MNYKSFPLSSIFSAVHTGQVHSSSELDNGDIPLISCKTEKSKDHGVEGFFNIPSETIYRNCVTITCDGEPCTASYHNYSIAVKDNVLVCIPKKEIKITTIFYAISYLNTQRWRFSYGRKCYENKIDKLNIVFPVKDDGEIDHEFIESNLNCEIKPILPQGKKPKKLEKMSVDFKEIDITELFNPVRGDFHSLTALNKGTMPTVSRTSLDNGIKGLYEPPDGAKIYDSGYLTVSTVSGEVFLQVKKFMATDNILILEPKIKLKLTTIAFIQTILNSQKWRYSYGRQCYSTKFSQAKLFLPVLKNGKLDEDSMEKIVKNTTYWNHVKPYLV